MTKTKLRSIAAGFAVIVLLAALLVVTSVGKTAGAEDAWDGVSTAEFEGSGTPEAPYEIANGKQFAHFVESVNDGNTYEGEYIVLSGDINLGGKELAPIGSESVPFKGSFDGSGNSIRNLKISTVGDNVALFRYNSGTISRLFLKNAQVSAAEGIGGICAYNSGTIEYCGIESGELHINDNGGNVGGIALFNYGTVNACFNSADIVNGAGLAGIVYSNEANGVVENCYNLGVIKATSGNASGICDSNYGAVRSCFNSGELTKSSDVINYGICANAYNLSTTEYCYNNSDVFHSTLLIGILALEGYSDPSIDYITNAELCSGTLPEGFDDTVWEAGSEGLDSSDGKFGTLTHTYPSLKNVGKAYSYESAEFNFGTADAPDWQEYTLITTAEEFIAIGNDETSWDKNYVLGDDINLAGKEFTPIGVIKNYSDITYFTGKFSGNGYSIKNAEFNGSVDGNDDCIGLFGWNNGLITDLYVENAKIIGSSIVGGICAKNCSPGTIRNCAFSGIMQGMQEVGGICGNNIGIIENCYSVGNIVSEKDSGGICGYNSTRGSIKNCYSLGKVPAGINNGSIAGQNDKVGNIKNCYYNKDVCSLGAIGSYDGTSSDNDANSVFGLTTSQFTNGNLPTGFDGSVWTAGSVDVSEPSGNFRTVTYTYPSLKNVGKAYSYESAEFNFGTAAAPDWQEYTLITMAEEFIAIGNDETSWDKNYVLGDDIDLAGKEITPIGVIKNYSDITYFTGKFSGSGHSIKNVEFNGSVDNYDDNYIGLFGWNNGLIIDLYVENAKIIGSSIVGGICANNSDSGTIRNCAFSGTLQGSHDVGGICGNNFGIIENCYSVGDIVAERYSGGICGYNGVNGSIKNCYSVGKVTAGINNGSIAGQNDKVGNIKNCYYNKDVCSLGAIGSYDGTSSDNDANSVFGLTTSQFTNGNLPTGFDGSVWTAGSVDVSEPSGNFRTVTYTYPSLIGVGKAYSVDVSQYNFRANGYDDWREYTLITTAEEFAAIGNDNTKWRESYVLGADIDMKGAELNPIGTDENDYFIGGFSGEGHTISSFKINKPDGVNVGLFGYSCGKIMNLCAAGDVVGKDNVGGLCGDSDDIAGIYNCGFVGTVTSAGGYHVGGLCGNNGNSTISNCYSIGKVSGGSDVGGLCGYSVGIIEYCYSSCTVSGESDVGGLCGEAYSYNNCYFNIDFYPHVNNVGVGITTEDICTGTVPYGFDESVWNAGSYSYEGEMYNIKLRTATYVYPSLKGIGSAHIAVETQYDYGFNGAEDWRRCTVISTADEFVAIGNDSDRWDENFVLGANIDLAGRTDVMPIGNSQGIYYKGIFSGDGHSVSNVTMELKDRTFVGIFGHNRGTIMNLSASGTIDGTSKVGGICGYNGGYGLIYNCSFSGSVSGQIFEVGGICGENSNIVENCYAIADVEALKNAGGICGISESTLGTPAINNCYFVGKVNARANVDAICGSNSGEISNCYYNTDICNVTSEKGTGLTTIQMTSGNALATMKFNNFIWLKKETDKENGVAYYPMLSEDSVPSVKYSAELDFKKTGEEEPVYGGDIEFSVKALLKFGEDVSIEDNNGIFEIRIGNEPVVIDSWILNGKAVYTADRAGETTFTLVYTSSDSEYFPDEVTATLPITIGKKALTEYDFTFTAPGYLTYNGAPKNAEVTADANLDGVGEITVEYYDESGAKVESAVNAGSYTVKISVDDGANYLGGKFEKSEWAFTVEKAKLVENDIMFTRPTDLNYSGTAKNASVTFCTWVNGAGDITLKYYDGSGREVEEAVNAGSYTVKAFVGDGENYLGGTFGGDNWAFTIEKAYISEDDFTLELPEDLTFDGSAKDVKVTPNKPDLGNYTVKFFYEDGTEVSEIVNAGRYYAVITADGNENYIGDEFTGTNFTVKFAKFEIITSDENFTWAQGGEHILPLPDSFPGDCGIISDISVNENDMDGVLVSVDYENGVLTYSTRQSEEEFVGSADIQITFQTQNYGTIRWNVNVRINERGNQPAPEKRDVTLTTTGNTFTAVISPADGAEYCFIKAEDYNNPDARIWGDNNTFTYLPHGDYIAYVRMKATKLYEASECALTYVFAHDADLAHFDKVKATCTERGTKDYYECSCGALFRIIGGDYQGVTAEELVIEPTGHSIVTTGSRPPMCTVPGNIEYYTCVKCKKIFSDRACENEITKADTVVPAAGHTWSDDYKFDENGHWHYCTVCDEVKAINSHKSGGEATETTPETCTVCGYVITPELGHIHAAHLTYVPAVKATCTADGNEAYYKCSCGKLFADENAETGITLAEVTVKAAGHKWSDDYKFDENGHWHYCTVCDEVKAINSHKSGGEATETTPETCTVCGYVITPELGHIHAAHLTYVPAVKATCTADGNEAYYKCSCGKLFADENAETEITLAEVTVKAAGHTWSEGYKFDKNGHWHICDVCGEAGESEEHISGGGPTYTKAEYCTICRYEISPRKSSGGSGGGRYSDDTNVPALNGSEMNWPDMAAEIGKLPEGSTVKIDLNGETKIPESVIRAIIDSKAKVEVVIDGTKSLIIDGAKIPAAAAVDVSAEHGDTDTSSLRGTMGVDFRTKGTGVPADMKLAFRRRFAGQFANIYRADNGGLVFVTCGKIASDGTVTISGTDAAGEYIAMICEYSDLLGDMNNDGSLNALDAAAILRDIVGTSGGANPLMADFNRDGAVNALDAAAILRFIVGMAA